MYQEKSVMSISQIYNNDKQRYVHGAGARSQINQLKSSKQALNHIIKSSIE